jgi:hypothetical protein
MKGQLAALMLGIGLASAQAAAEARVEKFIAYTEGELSVDADGRVEGVALDRKELGAPIMQAFEDRIRQWRFKPIVQEGTPVDAKARMRLHLAITRPVGGDEMTLFFQNVTFVDHSTAADQRQAVTALEPPSFPEEPAVRGIGAQVVMVVRTDSEGRVVQAAAGQVELLGTSIGKWPVRDARAFRRNSEKVAARWQLPAYPDTVLRIPVRFAPWATGDRWIRARMVPVEVPGWVVLELSSKDLVTLGDGGTESSRRWQLLTPTDS